MRGSRRRLDAELVRRGLVASRERAREAVAAGQVTVNGAVAHKAARLVLPGDALELLGPPARYVSRGGEKLEGALAAFGLDVAGLWCCDVGASTGGFTDCLLQRGAAGVVAVDVGRAQMHERLADDSRVTLHERTDVRDIDPAGIGAPFDLVTADVSFISLTSVMGCLAGLAAPGAPVVVLVKPQFEVGRQEASRGRGVIRDPELWQAALDRVLEAAATAGLAPQAATPSALKGAQGNVEFFLHLEKGGAPASVDSALVVSQVVTQEE
ncbi:MAG: TlyA family RNA methyltransferase [Acidimicrobiia bacterium]|nr:TlyA family RNA methyltransferase [Acidimicrobiia bacterium]MYG73690.1 TlyA family RNA methyltransferase [Acidimicrobiia bacterium]